MNNTIPYIIGYHGLYIQDIFGLSFSESYQLSSATENDYIYVNDIGTKLYTLANATTGYVTEYSMSAVHDINSLTETYRYELRDPNVLGSAYVLMFNPSGTEMYVYNRSPSPVDFRIYQYTLSAAWELSSTSYTRVKTISLSPDEGYNSISMSFSNDGTKLFMMQFSSGSPKIWTHSLSTPWNISTLSFQSSYTFSETLSTPDALVVKPGGDKLFIKHGGFPSGVQNISEFDLLSSYVISTESFLNTEVIPETSVYVRSIHFTPNWLNLYTLDSDALIKHYK